MLASQHGELLEHDAAAGRREDVAKLVERAGIIFKTGVNQPVKNGGTTRTFVLKNIPRGVPLRIMVRCQGSITVDAKHQTDATFKFAYTSLEMVK